MLFVMVTDERSYPWNGPFLREVGFPFFPFPGVFCARLILICLFQSRTIVMPDDI